MAPDGESSAILHSTGSNLADPSAVREWLGASYHAKQLALLDKFETELRLGRLSTTSNLPAGAVPASIQKMDRRAVTAHTVELLKVMIGGTRWKTPAELVGLLRGLGKELHSAGGFREPAIGNVVRRIIAAVREEVMNSTGAEEANTTKNTVSRSKQNDRSLESMLWALPQHVKPHGRSVSGQRLGSASTLHQRTGSSGETSADADSQGVPSLDLPPQFYQARPDLKQSIMEVIQELMSDLEDLFKNINDQVTNHIHADEVILTYGPSKTVELVSSHEVISDVANTFCNFQEDFIIPRMQLP